MQAAQSPHQPELASPGTNAKSILASQFGVGVGARTANVCKAWQACQLPMKFHHSGPADETCYHGSNRNFAVGSFRHAILVSSQLGPVPRLCMLITCVAMLDPAYPCIGVFNRNEVYKFFANKSMHACLLICSPPQTPKLPIRCSSRRTSCNSN